MNTNITMVSRTLHSKIVMSKYYWKLVENDAVPTIKFSIAKRVKGNTFINNCTLCLNEKAFIIRNLDDVNMLNKRSEIISKCRHINDY